MNKFLLLHKTYDSTYKIAVFHNKLHVKCCTKLICHGKHVEDELFSQKSSGEWISVLGRERLYNCTVNLLLIVYTFKSILAYR